MRFHLRTLKARAGESGRPVTWQDIAEGTGISRSTLLKMADNQVRAIRPKYVDALCAFFDVEIGELMTAERIVLPLDLDLRPDRRGKRFGEK